MNLLYTSWGILSIYTSQGIINQLPERASANGLSSTNASATRPSLTGISRAEEAYAKRNSEKRRTLTKNRFHPRSQARTRQRGKLVPAALGTPGGIRAPRQERRRRIIFADTVVTHGPTLPHVNTRCLDEWRVGR